MPTTSKLGNPVWEQKWCGEKVSASKPICFWQWALASVSGSCAESPISALCDILQWTVGEQCERLSTGLFSVTVLLQPSPFILPHTVSLAQRLPDFHFKFSGSGFTSHDHVWTKYKLRQQKSVFLETHRDFWALGVLFVFRVLEIKSLYPSQCKDF